MKIDRKRRLRASPYRRCMRAWLRHEGRIIRLLCISDYRPCVTGGEPREFVKRITHRRWPRGFHLFGCEWSRAVTAYYAGLPADEWVEEVIYDPGFEQGIAQAHAE